MSPDNSFVNVTPAPGTADPELSVTVPVNVAVTVWPNPHGPVASQAIATNVAIILNRAAIFLNPLSRKNEPKLRCRHLGVVLRPHPQGRSVPHHCVVVFKMVVFERTCP